MKVVYNGSFGGFCLSGKALERYAKLKDIAVPEYPLYNMDRGDPILVQVVEEMSPNELEIAEVPAGEKYRIDEYDGLEKVMTIDDYDWQIAT